MLLRGLFSGLLLLATLAGLSLAKTQQQNGESSILWTGQTADYASAPGGAFMSPEMQGVVLPADQNLMLVRRQPNRRKPNRFRQQLADRQLKSEGNNDTSSVKESANSTEGPDGNQLIRTGVALLGAALGREGCDLKAACLAAAMLPPMQGRDVIVLAAEAIVPQEWRKIYEAAKKSIIQKQDCDRFACL